MCVSGHPGAVRSAGPRRRDKGIVEQCCIKGCDLQHLEHYCAKPKRERRHTRHTRHTPSTLHMVRLLTIIYCFLEWDYGSCLYLYVFTLMTVGYVWCLVLCHKRNYKRIKSNTHRSLMDGRWSGCCGVRGVKHYGTCCWRKTGIYTSSCRVFCRKISSGWCSSGDTRRTSLITNRRNSWKDSKSKLSTGGSSETPQCCLLLVKKSRNLPSI